MSDDHTRNNRAVWFDVPVADLDRAAAFYRAVLAIGVDKQTYGDYTYCLLEHGDGIGGCLVKDGTQISSTGGILVYFNVDGRIHDAVARVTQNGGKILEPTHAIGPHGFRALVLDSEGNRIALHSTTDV